MTLEPALLRRVWSNRQLRQRLADDEADSGGSGSPILYANLGIPSPGNDSGGDMQVPLSGKLAPPNRGGSKNSLRTGPNTFGAGVYGYPFVDIPPLGEAVVTVGFVEFMLSNGAGTERLYVTSTSALTPLVDDDSSGVGDFHLGCRNFFDPSKFELIEQVGTDLSFGGVDIGITNPVLGITSAAGGQYFQQFWVKLVSSLYT